jgi:hypothetical protein
MSKKVLLIDDATGEYLPVANGTDGYVLTYDGDTSTPVWAAGGGGGGSGTVTSVTLSAGSTGLTISAASSQTITTSGTFTLAGTLALANGGTNASLTAVQGGVAYSTASGLALSAAGTDGQFLRSKGTSAPQFEGVPSDIMVNTTGVYGNSEVVLRLIAARAMSVTSTGSYFKCLTASSATKLVTVAQSGSASTSFDVTYSVAGGTTGSVPTGTTISLSAGDVLTVTMPATADLTLAGVYFTLCCTALGA